MKSKILVALLFIVLLVLGGIYGQLLTSFWTYIIDVVSRFWWVILIICSVVWFIKDRQETK